MTKEKAKSKPKHAPSRFSWVKILLLGMLVFTLIIISLILLPLVSFPAIITETSLPEELRPLAEEILATVPINEHISVTNDISLRLEYWENGYPPLVSAGQQGFCIWLPSARNNPYSHPSHIFINGERVRGISIGNGLGHIDGISSYARCAEGDLDTGLHLIEFHLRDSAWGDPVAIQHWAIEIE